MAVRFQHGGPFRTGGFPCEGTGKDGEYLQKKRPMACKVTSRLYVFGLHLLVFFSRPSRNGGIPSRKSDSGFVGIASAEAMAVQVSTVCGIVREIRAGCQN